MASTPRVGQTHSEKAKDCHDKAQVLSATLAWFLLVAGGGEFWGIGIGIDNGCRWFEDWYRFYTHLAMQTDHVIKGLLACFGLLLNLRSTKRVSLLGKVSMDGWWQKRVVTSHEGLVKDEW